MKRLSVLRQGRSDEQRALLHQLREKLLPMLERQAECYRKTIVPSLAEQGVFLRYWSELTPLQEEEAGKYFDSEISPALTPLVIDPVHPFLLSRICLLRSSSGCAMSRRGNRCSQRVKIPSVLKQWVSLKTDLEPGQSVMVPLSEVVRGNLHKLYSGMEISHITVMRLTRDAEVDIGR